MNAEALKYPMECIKQFDWKAATFAGAILVSAALWYLQSYFVTVDRYERDQRQTAEMLKEIRGDVKQILFREK